MEIGDKFGKLTVKKFLDERGPNGRKMVLCDCDCGKKDVICSIYNLTLKKNPTRSCGCLRLERVHESKTTHGDSGGAICGKRARLYRIWSNMKSRCYNPNVRSYADYGAKGIIVCDEWKNDYVAFKKWALEHGYNNDLVIDRIDPDKSYMPENCRWITSSENSIRAHEKACWGKNLETGEYVEFVNIRKFSKSRGLSFFMY